MVSSLGDFSFEFTFSIRTDWKGKKEFQLCNSFSVDSGTDSALQKTVNDEKAVFLA